MSLADPTASTSPPVQHPALPLLKARTNGLYVRRRTYRQLTAIARILGDPASESPVSPVTHCDQVPAEPSGAVPPSDAASGRRGFALAAAPKSLGPQRRGGSDCRSQVAGSGRAGDRGGCLDGRREPEADMAGNCQAAAFTRAGRLSPESMRRWRCRASGGPQLSSGNGQPLHADVRTGQKGCRASRLRYFPAVRR